MANRLIVRSIIAAAVGAFVALAVCWCFQHRAQVDERKQRLEKTTLRAELAMRRSRQRDIDESLYRVLKSSTLSSLAHPRVYYAHISAKVKGMYWISIGWVEDKPSPDGVRFKCGDVIYNLSISSDRLSNNRERAAQGAMTFNAYFWLKSGDPGYDLLDNHEPVTVQLTRNMEAISDPAILVYSTDMKQDAKGQDINETGP